MFENIYLERCTLLNVAIGTIATEEKKKTSCLLNELLQKNYEWWYKISNEDVLKRINSEREIILAITREEVY